MGKRKAETDREVHLCFSGSSVVAGTLQSAIFFKRGLQKSGRISKHSGSVGREGCWGWGVVEGWGGDWGEQMCVCVCVRACVRA